LAGRKRKSAISESSAIESAPKYRDRAAERREVFNQPDRPPPEALANPNPLKRKAEAVEAPKEPKELREDDSNKGNMLLAKMGWQTGTGLGREGEGRAEPVKVAIFGERQGLGRGKGVEAGKYGGQSGQRDRGRDVARERWEAEAPDS